MKSFFLSFLSNLFGNNNAVAPSRADVVTAAVTTAITALNDHAATSQAAADQHATAIDTLSAKHAELLNEAVTAASLALKIGALVA